MTKRVAVYLGAVSGVGCLIGLLWLPVYESGRASPQTASMQHTPLHLNTVAGSKSEAPKNDARGELAISEPSTNLDSAAEQAAINSDTALESKVQQDATAMHDLAYDPRLSNATDALKEAFMQEHFGVIKRDDRWLPTIAGGTNIVYITTGSIPAGRVSEPYDVQFQATSGFPPYHWNLVGGELPPGFILDAQSGRLAGIPLEACSSVFFLQVTDSKGVKDVAEYFLAVQPDLPLEIVTENLPAAFPGEEYHIRFEGRGGIPPYAWNAQTLHDEIGMLALDPQTGSLYIQVPLSAPEIDLPLIISLYDSQISVTKELTLHVRTRLSILDLPSSPAHEGDEFSFVFRATGGAEPYTWGLATPLPPGLELSANGCCSGHPSQPGLYDVSLWVSDAAGQTASAVFTLQVLPLLPVVSNFEALLSRNSVALQWELPAMDEDINVRIIRTSDAGETTVFQGAGTGHLDRDVGAGTYYYTAIMESNGMPITSAPPPVIRVTLPPEADPFADRVVAKNLLHPNAFRAADLPGIVLGAPRGTGLAWGSTDVVSLGAATCNDAGASAPYGGSITLEFVDNLVWDGPGADFTVFENVFYVCNAAGVPDPETRFMEPALVSVSQDGINWRQFKTDFSPRYDPATGKLNLRHPYCYNSGFAGVNPIMSNGYTPDPTDPAVSGGDSFDISELGFKWIRYVRIQSTGNRWLTDSNGNLIHHTEEQDAANRNSTKSGFDLDAVSAIWMHKEESK